MDQAQLLELAQQALYYMSPLIATGALSKVGEEGVDAARSLARKTWVLLEAKFKGDEAAEAALTLYKVKPEDKSRQEIVEGEIVTRFIQDTAGTNELASLVRQARDMDLIPQQVAERIHNQVIKDNAVVGSAIAGDTHGSIRVNMGGTDR